MPPDRMKIDPSAIAAPVDRYGYAWADARPAGVGVEIPAKAGTMIVAPEAGVVRAVWRAPDPPWEGFPPAGLVIRGGTTGLYHVIGGMDPKRWDYDRAGSQGYYNPPSVGLSVNLGQGIGAAAGSGVVRWEVRRRLDVDAGDDPDAYAVDPIALLTRGEVGPFAAAPAASGGGIGILLLAVLAIVMLDGGK